MTPEFPFENNRSLPASDAERALLLRFPLFFRAVHDPESYCADIAYWGIRCGPGWYQIIDEAASKIEVVLQDLLATFDVRGHLGFLDRRLIGNLELDNDEQLPLIPVCSQIKEKFGGLRLHVDRGIFCEDEAWELINKAVEEAERKAGVTCESCGQPGKLRKRGWLRVTCAICERKKT